MPTLKIGLGQWFGEYRGITRQWLRWYDVGELDSHGCRTLEQERQQQRFGSTAARFSSTAARFGSTANRTFS